MRKIIIYIFFLALSFTFLLTSQTYAENNDSEIFSEDISYQELSVDEAKETKGSFFGGWNSWNCCWFWYSYGSPFSGWGWPSFDGWYSNSYRGHSRRGHSRRGHHRRGW